MICPFLSAAAAPTLSLYALQVLIKKERQDIAPLDQPPAGAPAGVKCYKATIKPAVKKGSSQEFDVVATITGAFTANPAKIEQTERQYVEYLDNLYLLSPYVVEKQTTVVSNQGTGGCAWACGDLGVFGEWQSELPGQQKLQRCWWDLEATAGLAGLYRASGVVVPL
jgi:hypothetical protein